MGTRFAESGRVHTTNIATRAHVRCRTLYPLSLVPQAGVLPCAAEAQSRSCHKVQRQLEVTQWWRCATDTRCRDASSSMWLPSRLRISLRCGPQMQRRRVAAVALLSLCLLAMQSPRGSLQWDLSVTETLTTRWVPPLLLQMIISLRPSIIFPTGSLFQYRSARSCSAHPLGRTIVAERARRLDYCA